MKTSEEVKTTADPGGRTHDGHLRAEREETTTRRSTSPLFTTGVAGVVVGMALITVAACGILLTWRIGVDEQSGRGGGQERDRDGDGEAEAEGSAYRYLINRFFHRSPLISIDHCNNSPTITRNVTNPVTTPEGHKIVSLGVCKNSALIRCALGRSLFGRRRQVPSSPRWRLPRDVITAPRPRRTKSVHSSMTPVPF